MDSAAFQDRFKDVLNAGTVEAIVMGSLRILPTDIILYILGCLLRVYVRRIDAQAMPFVVPCSPHIARLREPVVAVP